MSHGKNAFILLVTITSPVDAIVNFLINDALVRLTLVKPFIQVKLLLNSGIYGQRISTLWRSNDQELKGDQGDG